MAFMFTFLSGYHLWRMYVAYGLYEANLSVILMNSTSKVTFLAWSISDYYVREHVETQMKLVKFVSKRKNSKFEGYGQISSNKSELDKNIAKITKEFNIDEKTLLNELENVSLEPELLREHLLANLPKVNYKDTSKMSEKEAKIQTIREREIEDKCLRVIDKLPTIIEYMSYSLTFIGLTSPMINYDDFYDFIYLRKNYQVIKIVGKQILYDVCNLFLYQVIFVTIHP